MRGEPVDNFVVRFPRSLRQRIGEVARFYRRSVNSEILLRLDYSLNGLPSMAREHSMEPPMFAAIERTLRGNLTQEEELLVLCYRRLSGAKRKALLDLLSA